MTIADIYMTLMLFFIAGIFVSAAAAVITIIAAVCEYLCGNVLSESTLKAFYDFYLKGFLPTMLLLMATVIALKVIGGF